MSNRIQLQCELIDLKRFAKLVGHISANADHNFEDMDRLISAADLLVAHILGMEQRVTAMIETGVVFPGRAAA